MRNMLQGRRPSPALVIAVIALCVALGGTAVAAKKFSGKNVRKNSLPGNRIKDDSATGKQIAEGTLVGVKAGNVMAASVPVGNSCTLDSNTGGISAAINGTRCDVTFPRSVANCAVGATPLHPSSDVGGEATIRKLGRAVVKVGRYDSTGGTSTAGLFAVFAVCP